MMNETAITTSIAAAAASASATSKISSKSKSKSLLGRLRIVKATNSKQRDYLADEIEENVVSSYPKEVVLVVNNKEDRQHSDDNDSSFNDDGFSLNSGTNHDHDGHSINHREDNDSNNVTTGSSIDGGIETSLESMRRLTKKPSKFTFDLMPSFSLESMEDGQEKGITAKEEQQADNDHKFMTRMSSKEKEFSGTKAFRNRTRTSSTVATSEDDDEEVLMMMSDDQKKKENHRASQVAKETERAKFSGVEDDKTNSAEKADKTATVAAAATSAAYGASTPGSIGFWPSLVTPDNIHTAVAGSKPRVTTTAANSSMKKDVSSRDNNTNNISSLFPGLGSWSIFG